MRVEDLELAAEFCKLVGASNLVDYLGLDATAPQVEAQARLKARRKFMQGMQGNPKYKREALFLIRHFSSLNEALGDLVAYAADARRRAESEHLPVIEMTIRGVLRSGAGATPTEDQVSYLRRNAAELGVTETTFREILTRVAQEHSVVLPGHLSGAPSPVPAPEVTPPGVTLPPEEAPADLYLLLGVSPTATDEDVRVAFRRKVEELEAIDDPVAHAQLHRRYEIARKVLSNTSARRHYDVTATRTGPPARVREVRPQLAPTAPPIADRSTSPMRPARLEILGEPVRTLRLGSGTAVGKIVIRNGGDGPMGGSVASEARWLNVHPPRLDPSLVQQTVTVRVDSAAVPEGVSSGAVLITTDRGERARVVFELRRSPPVALLVGAAAAVGFVVVVGLIVLFVVF